MIAHKMYDVEIALLSNKVFLSYLYANQFKDLVDHTTKINTCISLQKPGVSQIYFPFSPHLSHNQYVVCFHGIHIK